MGGGQTAHTMGCNLRFEHPMQTHVCADQLSLCPFRWYVVSFEDRQDGVGCKFFRDDKPERTSNDGRIDRYLFICDDFVARRVWVV